MGRPKNGDHCGSDRRHRLQLDRWDVESRVDVDGRWIDEREVGFSGTLQAVKAKAAKGKRRARESE